MAANNRWTTSDVLTATKLNATIQQWGLDADKPVPTLVGQSYLATDTAKIYFSLNGSSWDHEIEIKANRDVASGYPSLDALKASNAHRLRGFIGGFGNNFTTVQGTWTTTNNASQTDWSDILVSQAGYYYNSTGNDLDEIKWSNLVLNAGTYQVYLITYGDTEGGMLELLHGTTSLGTHDNYNVGYNHVINFTYSPSTRASADFRLRCNGAGGGAGYKVRVSRLEIFKTA